MFLRVVALNAVRKTVYTVLENGPKNVPRFGTETELSPVQILVNQVVSQWKRARNYTTGSFRHVPKAVV